MPHISDIELREINERTVKLANHKMRLQHSLELILTELGYSEIKQKIMLDEIKAANFSFIDLIHKDLN